MMGSNISELLNSKLQVLLSLKDGLEGDGEQQLRAHHALELDQTGDIELYIFVFNMDIRYYVLQGNKGSNYRFKI